MIKVKQVILTPTQIEALYATPLIVLPAPPTGYVNNILSVTERLDFKTTPYTGVIKTMYQSINSDGNIIFESEVIANHTSILLPTVKKITNQTILATTDPIYLTTDATATDGDSQFTITIVYDQVAIS
jgi:hypothetical protein